jgi:hypothetical protein
MLFNDMPTRRAQLDSGCAARHDMAAVACPGSVGLDVVARFRQRPVRLLQEAEEACPARTTSVGLVVEATRGCCVLLSLRCRCRSASSVEHDTAAPGARGIRRTVRRQMSAPLQGPFQLGFTAGVEAALRADGAAPGPRSRSVRNWPCIAVRGVVCRQDGKPTSKRDTNKQTSAAG